MDAATNPVLNGFMRNGQDNVDDSTTRESSVDIKSSKSDDKLVQVCISLISDQASTYM